MRLSAVAALMILTTVLLSGCGQTQQAVLDDRSQNFYARNNQILPAAIPGAPLMTNSSFTQQAAPLDAIVTTNLMPMQPNKAAIPFGAPSKPLVTATAKPGSWQWPVDGKITEQFGPQGNGITNEGITIAAADGTPIRAAQSGEVAYIGNGIKDYGNMVILRHANGDMTSYAHARNIIVKKGDQVAAGNTIGYVGKTGRAKTPQLHFALHEGDRTIDPLSKLPQHFAAN